MITITSYLGWSSRASASIVSPRTSCSWRAGNSNENDRGAPAARRRKPVAANASGLRHACSIHHRVVLATVNNPSDRTTSTPLRRSCGHDNGRFSLCSRGIGCAAAQCRLKTLARLGPVAVRRRMSLRDAHPVPVAVVPSRQMTRPPLAEGTDGCGAGWSSPKGRPLKTTNATKRRTAPNATAVRLTRSPKDCLANSHRVQCSIVTAVSAAAAEPEAYGRRGAALSTGRARRTTSPPGPRARTASRRAATFCRPGRRGGAEGFGPLSSRPAQCCQPVVRGEPPHASAPAQLRAANHRSAVPAAAADRRLNGHRIRIWSRSAVNVET